MNEPVVRTARLPLSKRLARNFVNARVVAEYAEETGDPDAARLRVVADAFDGSGLVFGTGPGVEIIARIIDEMAGEEYGLAAFLARHGDYENAQSAADEGAVLRWLAHRVVVWGKLFRAQVAAEKARIPRCVVHPTAPIVARCRGTDCYVCDPCARDARRSGVVLEWL